MQLTIYSPSFDNNNPTNNQVSLSDGYGGTNDVFDDFGTVDLNQNATYFLVVQSLCNGLHNIPGTWEFSLDGPGAVGNNATAVPTLSPFGLALGSLLLAAGAELLGVSSLFALLAVLGGPSKEQNNNLPNGFLMEVMETREALESAVDGGDAGTIAAGLSAARAQRAAFIAEISALFQELASPPSPEGLAALRTQLNAWRYVERLIDQVGDAPEARR